VSQKILNITYTIFLAALELLMVIKWRHKTNNISFVVSRSDDLKIGAIKDFLRSLLNKLFDV